MAPTQRSEPLTGFPKSRLSQRHLPTKRDVICLYRFYQEVLRKPPQECYKGVVEEVGKIWDDLGSGCRKVTKNIIRNLKKLVSDWKRVQKDIKKTNTKTLKNVETFKARLSSSFCIQSQPCTNLHVDKPRPRVSIQPKSEMLNQRLRSRAVAALENDSESEDDMQQTEQDADWQYPNTVQPKNKRINVLNRSVAENLDRDKISNRAAVGILGSAIDALDVGLDQVTLSKSSMCRKRKDARKQIADEVIAKFDKRKGVVVHFDGKQLVSSSKRKQEMLAVVVTGPNTEQILNCAFLRNGTAQAVAEQVLESLKAWDLTEFVRGKGYDTTNVNSGEKNGAGVILERFLGRKLLDLPCRHHVLELILMTTYNAVFKEKTTSPDDNMFKTFRETWDQMDHKKFSGLDAGILTKEELGSLKEFCTKMSRELHVRDDYQELLQLAILCLDPTKRFTFKRPGAVHHARWMAKAIYGLKIFLFRDQFAYDGVTIDMLQRFVLFVIRIYLKGWFQAPLAVSAPRHDLEFVNALSKYGDSQLAEATSKKFKNHLWYLSELNICLAFFDDAVSDEDKRAMVKRLKKKSAGRNIVRAKTFKQTLPEYVTVKSLDFFKILKIDHEFLFNKDPATWPADVNFIRGKEVAKSLSVTNDCAERAIALYTNFHGIGPKSEIEKNQLILTVSKNKKAQNNSLKSSVREYLLQNTNNI